MTIRVLPMRQDGLAPAAFMPSGLGPAGAATADPTAGIAVDTATVLATESRRLDDLAGASPVLRWDVLADLASRLRALAGQVPDSDRRALLRVVEALSVCDGPPPRDLEALERFWQWTAAELQKHGANKRASRGNRHGGFWRR